MNALDSWHPSRPVDKYRILIIDNYDSYAYNLYQRIGEITGRESTVVRNDRVSAEWVASQEPTHVIISPGPGSPEDPAYFGICADVIRNVGKTTPILGVCLGHQGIGHVFGGRVVRASRVMHGKTSIVTHDQSALFDGIEDQFTAMRYHSLVIAPESVPPCLVVTATAADGTIMAIRHVSHPILGVQFHPESIGTPVGVRILRNFLEMWPMPVSRGAWTLPPASGVPRL